MTHSRGTDPSCALIRLEPLTSFDRFTGTLQFEWNGTSFTFANMAVSACPFRFQHGRDGYRWDAIALDQRWKWRYPRVSGEYNKRLCDGEIDPESQRDIAALVDILAAALQADIDPGDLPTNVYPYVNWNNAVAKLELEAICEAYGMIVCPKLDGTFTLEPLTAAASLPPGGDPVSPPGFSYKPSVMPSTVQASCAPKTRQKWIELRCVGMDTDGTVRLPDNLSYKPGTGWTTEWPYAFPGVAQAQRHLAFQTMYRLYEPVDSTIWLCDHAAETGQDDPRQPHRICLPPQVRGVFWTLDDFRTNTPFNALYSGEFRVRTDWNLVEFSYPVWKWDGGLVKPADLQIATAYRVKNGDGTWDRYTLDEEVPESVVATEPRILQHPELKWVDIIDSPYGGSGNNEPQVQAEAQRYLDAIVQTYAFDKAQDVIYEGLLNVELSASVAQVKWWCGNSRPALTRVGCNEEFDLYSPHLQERRSRQRVSQLAERFVL